MKTVARPRDRRGPATYWRLETDAEFKERLYAMGVPRDGLCALALNGLDEWAWGEYKVQRKLVEVTDEPSART